MTNIDLTALRAEFEILAWCKAKEAEIKTLRTSAEDKIKAALGPGNTGYLDGDPVVEWSISKRNTLDTKAIKEELPEVYAQYLKTGEVNNFSMIKPEKA